MNLPYLDVLLTTGWVVAEFHRRQRNPAVLELLSSPKPSWGGGDLLVTPALPSDKHGPGLLTHT